MTQENPKLTITLSGRRPVTIVKAQWPIVASAKAEAIDDAHKLFVRQRRDKRAWLVYGIATSEGQQNERAGELLQDVDDDEVEAAVKRIGRHLDFTDVLINECLAELPAEEI